MIVNEGWSIFHVFSKVVGTKVHHLGKQFYHCHASHLIPDGNVELSQPRTHSQLNLDEDIFHVGETLLYSKEGHTVYVQIKSIDLGSDGALRFTVKPSDSYSFTTNKESFRDPDSPDIGWIHSTVSEKKSSVADLPLSI